VTLNPRILTEKSPGLLVELEEADPRLRVLVYYAAALSIARFGIVPVLTRVRGTRAETIARHGADARVSVHEVDPCRGADLRTRGLLTDMQAQTWEDELDQTIQYELPYRIGRDFTCATFETQAKALARGRDPALPPVVSHLHLQVPPWESATVPTVRLWDAWTT